MGDAIGTGGEMLVLLHNLPKLVSNLWRMLNVCAWGQPVRQASVVQGVQPPFENNVM